MRVCPTQTHGLVRKEPLSQRQVLSTLENMYDAVLRVEQLRREQPSQEDEEALQTWYSLWKFSPPWVLKSP
jgi:hypothetical protein